MLTGPSFDQVKYFLPKFGATRYASQDAWPFEVSQASAVYADKLSEAVEQHHNVDYSNGCRQENRQPSDLRGQSTFAHHKADIGHIMKGQLL